MLFFFLKDTLSSKNNMFFSVQSNHHLIITDHHLEIAAKAAALTILRRVSNTVQAQLWASTADLRYWLGSSDIQIINHCLEYCFSPQNVESRIAQHAKWCYSLNKTNGFY